MLLRYDENEVMVTIIIVAHFIGKLTVFDWRPLFSSVLIAYAYIFVINPRVRKSKSRRLGSRSYIKVSQLVCGRHFTAERRNASLSQGGYEID